MSHAVPATREEAERQQLQSLRALLAHAWRHSAFYRDHYAAHGIAEKDLPGLTVRDLPFVSRQQVMEHFDAVVTDRRLRLRDIEQWLTDDHDPAAHYQQHFVVVHTSGSSGRPGIFVYGRADWQVMNSIVAPRMPPPERDGTGKSRAAFYLATQGHFAGITTARHMPAANYVCLYLSVLDPVHTVVEALNDFQPDRLTGYSSAIATLAGLEREGTLRISPRTVLVSGEPFTPPMARTIADAWAPRIYVTYSASEAPYMAIKYPAGDDMTVMDDLNVLEVLDEAQRPVPPGAQGRAVVTNLFNYTLPLIRYGLDDTVTRASAGSETAFTRVRSIEGKATDGLPVLMDDGAIDALPHTLLAEMIAPGLERYQYVSERPDHVRIDYVAPHAIDETIGRLFQRWLTMKGATRTSFQVRRVPRIVAEARTGKSPLVRRKWAPEPSAGADLGLAPAPPPPHRVAPTTPFIPFPAEAVEQSIPARFEQQARQHAGRLAVHTPQHTLTYAALNEAANRLARAILAASERTAAPIALLFEHGAPMIVALLGVLKAGKVFTALDPTYPPSRLAGVLADTESRLLVTDTASWSLAQQLAPSGARILNADAVDAALPGGDLDLPIAPDALAYILYTSGTTGQPKGVVHDHRGLLHTVMKYTNGSHIAAEDRLTLFHSYGFGAAMTNIFGALLNGASLFPYDLRKDAMAQVAARLQRDGITVYHSVPTVFRYFTDALGGDEAFPAMRLIELNGEPVSPREVERYRRHFPRSCLLHNRMGPTEMGIARQYFLDHDTPLGGGTVPVGYAVADTEVLLLDDRGREVSGNAVGEIAIRSRYLFRGYWRQPELTRAALLPDPQGTDARLYRTGDVGRLRPDGCLLYLGRKDARVKIRGFLVDPVEVEGVLGRHPAVTDSVVMAREDRPGDPALAAYVVTAAGAAPTVIELRRFMQEHLPAHMIPTAIVFLEGLPLLPTGKVDRRTLPAPTQEPLARSQPVVAPRTPHEEELARIWGDLLGYAPVGVDDDFFEVGGHSLLATQLLNRVLARFGFAVPPRVFFDAPTVAQLALAVAQLEDSA